MQGENPSESLKRYILGELNEEEMTAIEAAYFADDDTLNELHTMRDDLLDAWARGELSHAEAQSLSRQLTRNPAWRERAAFAVQLQALSPAPKQAKTFSLWERWRGSMPNWQWVAAAAVVAAVTVCGTWWTRRHRAAHETAPVAIMAPTIMPSLPLPVASPSLVAKPERKSPKPAALNNASVHVLGLLLPLTTRDLAELPEVTLTNETQVLRLQLELPSSAQTRLRLFLQNAEGQSIWESQLLSQQTESDAPFVSCDVPVQSLLSGVHHAILRSSTNQIITQSDFRVTKP